MASSTPSRNPSTRPPVRLDQRHEAATEAAQVIDREHEARGERTWTRLALDHEICIPGHGCSFPLMVDVIVLAAAVRVRQPLYGRAVPV